MTFLELSDANGILQLTTASLLFRLVYEYMVFGQYVISGGSESKIYANKLCYIQNFSFITEKWGGGVKAFDVLTFENTRYHTT